MRGMISVRRRRKKEREKGRRGSDASSEASHPGTTPKAMPGFSSFHPRYSVRTTIITTATTHYYIVEVLPYSVLRTAMERESAIPLSL